MKPYSQQKPLKSHALDVRGMPRWREKQQQLPVPEKIAMLGKAILQARALEMIKLHASGL